jgi:hypothetical protein
MIRTALGAVAVIACGAPAGLGLLGNSSFSQAVPVRTPQQAVHAAATPPLRTMPTPARRGDDTRADDHRHHGGREAEPGDDRGREAEPGDDRQGRHRSDDRHGRHGSGGRHGGGEHGDDH